MPYVSYKLSNQVLSTCENCFIQGSALILFNSVFQISGPFTNTLEEVFLSLCRGILIALAYRVE